VFAVNGSLNATFVTFSSNSAAQGGTDLYVLGDKTDAGVLGNGTATVTLTNDILGQSGTTTVSDFFANSTSGGSAPSLGGGNNLISDNPSSPNGFTGGTLSATDPLLAALANNGGPTQTMALQAGSPAIDAGVAVSSITTDQRGDTRPTPPSTGAFEPGVSLGQAGPTITASAGPIVVLGTGTPLTASATLVNGVNEAGSLNFTLYHPTGKVVDTETAAVHGDGTYTTPHGYLPTVAGTYQWVASYGGDAHNLGGSTAKGDTPEIAVNPGATVIGSSLYFAGGNTNNQVNITPTGVSKTGSTGIKVSGTLNSVSLHNLTYSQGFTTIYLIGFNGNDHIRLYSLLTINTVITEGNGNDQFQLGNGNNTITLGNGNDSIHAGNGNNVVVAGNGNDHVSVCNGDNNITLGSGDDNIQAGNGNNVIVAGGGTDNIQAGNGDNLVVGGFGRYTIRAGNGNNILIDGAVQLTRPGDTLTEVLSNWIEYAHSPANVAGLKARLQVTYNVTYANTLRGGSGEDWFFAIFANDHLNRKPTDLQN